jgi:uncharacterized protein (DUF1800 family)
MNEAIAPARALAPRVSDRTRRRIRSSETPALTDSAAIPQQHRALHALNRLGFGPRPGELKRVQQTGYERYIEEQLNPDSIPIPRELSDRVASFRTLQMSPLGLFIEYWRPVMEAQREYRQQGKARGSAAAADQNSPGKQAVRNARIRARVVASEAVQARVLRAIDGPRHLQEVMTAFWFNHFNVFAGKGLDLIWTGSFEQTAIRPHTMGKFRALLGATARHPAMLFYLDNWRNTAPGSPGARKNFDGINENYARELMELHTLGVGGGYTQQDVIALAHILTGWGLPPGREQRAQMRERTAAAAEGAGGFGRFRRFRRGAGNNPGGFASIDPSGFYFDASRHDFQSKTFLGHTIAGAGLSEGEHALDILARSPATARHLSYQLAQYFVADEPPPALVDRMAARYSASDGDIRAVLETMFASGEFWERRYWRAKFKTPYEFVISSVRATGAPMRNFRPLYGAIALLGMPPYGCQTPNGYANTQQAWLNPDAMMMRVSFATALGTGHLPLERPPFQESAAGAGAPISGAAMREPKLFGKRGANPRMGGANPRMGIDLGAAAAERRAPAMAPPDAVALADTLGGQFEPATLAAVEQANPALRAALILGSPDFMMR